MPRAKRTGKGGKQPRSAACRNRRPRQQPEPGPAHPRPDTTPAPDPPPDPAHDSAPDSAAPGSAPDSVQGSAHGATSGSGNGSVSGPASGSASVAAVGTPPEADAAANAEADGKADGEAGARADGKADGEAGAADREGAEADGGATAADRAGDPVDREDDPADRQGAAEDGGSVETSGAGGPADREGAAAGGGGAAEGAEGAEGGSGGGGGGAAVPGPAGPVRRVPPAARKGPGAGSGSGTGSGRGASAGPESPGCRAMFGPESLPESLFRSGSLPEALFRPESLPAFDGDRDGARDGSGTGGAGGTGAGAGERHPAGLVPGPSGERTPSWARVTDGVPGQGVRPSAPGPFAPEAVPETAPEEGTSAPEAAFDQLYLAHGRSLTRQAFLLCGHRKMARRAVEWAFHQAWQNWPEVEADGDPGSWVRASVYTYALSPWHQLRPGRGLPEAYAGPPRDRALLEALLRLPRCYRATVLLHDGLGLSLSETAAETEASARAAGARLAHARAALVDDWAPLHEAPERERGTLLARALRELGAAQPVRLLPPRLVRRDSERTTRGWTAASVALTVVITVATVFTLMTSDEGKSSRETAPGVPEPGTGAPLRDPVPGPGTAGAAGHGRLPSLRALPVEPRTERSGPAYEPAHAYLPQLRSTNTRNDLDDFLGRDRDRDGGTDGSTDGGAQDDSRQDDGSGDASASGSGDGVPDGGGDAGRS
ncbi:sigma factor-like helix-turn-helix DNA-binding protein [Streptomyces cacaoi]